MSVEQWSTARLAAQRLGPEHLTDITCLHRDPAVMRTLSADGQPLPDDQTAASLEKAAAHWDQYGFGLWAFYDRSTGAFIGRGGLLHYTLEDLDKRREIGLAYAVLSSHWGQGLATEMARGIVHLGFADLAFQQLASWTLLDNRASQRILEKLGFKYQQNFTFATLPHRFYLIRKSSFQ